ncbi:membrane hypothetical protein [Alphaproteobacteria bacterium]
MKYLWAPLLDYYSIPYLDAILGKRNSWLPVVQIFLSLAVIGVGMLDPIKNMQFLIVLCVIATFLSATRDTLIDAFRVGWIPSNQQGVASTAAISGYRFGMLMSGAGALYIATYTSWSSTYMIFVSVIASTIPVKAFVVWVQECVVKNNRAKLTQSIDLALPEKAKYSLIAAFINPFQEFCKRTTWIPIVLLIICYKLSDAYLANVTNPFLVQTGFTKIEIANIIKMYGTVATFIGMFLGGYILTRLSFKTSILGGIGADFL